jgi:hypothetical protein
LAIARSQKLVVAAFPRRVSGPCEAQDPLWTCSLELILTNRVPTFKGYHIAPNADLGEVARSFRDHALHILAYNLKRMITIFGVGPLMAAIKT